MCAFYLLNFLLGKITRKQTLRYVQSFIRPGFKNSTSVPLPSLRQPLSSTSDVWIASKHRRNLATTEISFARSASLITHKFKHIAARPPISAETVAIPGGMYPSTVFVVEEEGPLDMGILQGWWGFRITHTGPRKSRQNGPAAKFSLERGTSFALTQVGEQKISLGVEISPKR